MKGTPCHTADAVLSCTYLYGGQLISSSPESHKVLRYRAHTLFYVQQKYAQSIILA